MNKYPIGDRISSNNLRRVLKVMRKTLFLLFCSVLFSQAATSYSQVFSFNLKSTSIKDACREIERNSDYIFVFSDNSERVMSKRINVDVNSNNVEEILDTILSETGLTYRILDKQIVVYESKEAIPAKHE